MSLACPLPNDDDIAVSSLFVTPLISVPHPDAPALNAELLRRIAEQQRAEDGVRRSNQGGWQSGCGLESWAGHRGEELVAFVKSLANKLTALNHPDRGLLEAEIAWSCSSWANVNATGDANLPHIHAGAYWSAVYYVDDGADYEGHACGGELEFMDPRGGLPNMLAPDLKTRLAGCLNAGLSHFLTPRSGQLVMFPSWLMHAVRPFRGSRPRVSIAFNLAVPPGALAAL